MVSLTSDTWELPTMKGPLWGFRNEDYGFADILADDYSNLKVYLRQPIP